MKRLIQPRLLLPLCMSIFALSCSIEGRIGPLMDMQRRYALEGASAEEWISLAEAFEECAPGEGCAALFGAGVSYYDAETMERAADAFERLLTEYPESPRAPEALYYLAQTYEANGRSADAARALRLLTNRYPNHRYADEAFNRLTGGYAVQPGTGSENAQFASKRIVLDAGHGGMDPGAVGRGGKREKEVVLDIANRLRRLLASDGFRVVMTRSDDRHMPLSERNDLGKNGADLFISLHVNAARASSASGIETWIAPAGLLGFRWLSGNYSRQIHAQNRAFAEALQRGMTAQTGAKNRGVKEGSFAVLSGLQIPAALVEMGFLTNPAEAARLAQPAYRQRLAEGIANGVRAYLEGQSLS